MKNKYIDAIFMGILICILFSLSFIGPSLVTKKKTVDAVPSNSPAFMDTTKDSNYISCYDVLKTLTIQERNNLAREAHSQYTDLVDAIMELRSKGFLTYDDIVRIHNSIMEYGANIPTEVPYTDKDFLEYLYDNNIITKAQYEQIYQIIDEAN